jgi:hypothetical protein
VAQQLDWGAGSIAASGSQQEFEQQSAPPVEFCCVGVVGSEISETELEHPQELSLLLERSTIYLPFKGTGFKGQALTLVDKICKASSDYSFKG